MGTLYIVATPIGNLEDITLRALRVLREVQLIAAEDTRRTAKLLQHYSIATPTTSLHEHNEHRKTETLLTRLDEGAAIALVSDAGTPLVSDPGRYLVKAARGARHAVIPVPGPSAIMAMLSGAGADVNEFSFLGFAPRKSSDLNIWIQRELRSTRVVVFFETPHRVRYTLSAMLDILGDRPIYIGRELTKLHEKLVFGPISEHIGRENLPRGEYVILVEPDKSGDEVPTYPGDAQVVVEIGQMVERGLIPPRAAAKRVAAKYHLPVNVIYRLWATSRK